MRSTPSGLAVGLGRLVLSMRLRCSEIMVWVTLRAVMPENECQRIHLQLVVPFRMHTHLRQGHCLGLTFSLTHHMAVRSQPPATEGQDKLTTKYGGGE